MCCYNIRILGAVAAQLWVEAGTNIIWRDMSSLWIFPSDTLLPVREVAMVPMHVLAICLYVAIPGIVEGMETGIWFMTISFQ